MIRILTTFALAAFVLVGIWYFPLWLNQTLILVAIGLGLLEYTKLTFKEKGWQALTFLLGLSFASLMTWFPFKEALLIGLTGVVFLAFLWALKSHEPLESLISHVALVILGVCYLGLTLPSWGWLFQFGKEYVMLLLFPACLTDTFGFLVGKTCGRRKLAPIVSPNKTWEGFFGGLFGGIFGVWIASKIFFQGLNLSWSGLVVVGLGCSLLAIFGDLIESLIKRSAGVKDSGNLIPGHGGALDRLDALIFVAPVFYWVLKGTIVR